MALSDAERERLRAFGAKVMGWEQEASGNWYDRLGHLTVTIEDWDPLVSLDQAVQVAEAVGLWRDYCLEPYDIGGSTPIWLYRVARRANMGDAIASSKTPAEALLVACADAAGEVWRDG